MSRGLTFRSLVLMVCMLLAAGAAHAAAGALATPEARAHGIEWRPVSAELGLVLTVSGPAGFFWRQEVGPGGSPSFSVFDQGGQLRPTGSYVYELRAVPQIDDATRAEMDAARETGAGTVAKAGKVFEAQSGAFAIRGGAIVMGGEEPQPGKPTGPQLSTKDFVIADDLIVNGGSSSICVGFDCVNGESFGFDTIRLKENSTRIKFEDTSGAGFPSTDWQLTANDSAGGGQNKFSIEDITSARVPFTITGGASTNSIFVDSVGRVGFRTSTPVLDLHVATSNTPALRLEQNSSGGFTAQTWDVAGNEANFFVRSVTTGSQLPFRIRPGAPSSSIDIAANGDVGIGTASPTVDLDVVQTDANTGFRLQRAGNPVTMLFEDTTAGKSWEFKINAAGAFAVNDPAAAGGELTLESNGNVTIKGDYFSATCTAPGSPCAPDYVFAPEYELMPLGELRSFLEANRHLPNVPSEAELKKAGQINLSQFQLTLLEKIEELTLYTLDQQAYIERLESRLTVLEAEREEEPQVE